MQQIFDFYVGHWGVEAYLLIQREKNLVPSYTHNNA